MADDRLKTLEERTRYEPAEVEGRIFARWEQAGIFSPEPEGSAAENYSIAVPPPNVTGNLHMGHALNASIQDACIRVARMRGRRAKWIFGTDHAGIATQRQVEKRLEGEGTSREQIGRAEFIARVWRWREEYGDTIVGQFKALGASLDYRDERFTMDDDYVRAVTHVFVRLYEKRLIYRDNYLVNWDPGLRRAISDRAGDDGAGAGDREHAIDRQAEEVAGVALGHRSTRARRAARAARQCPGRSRPTPRAARRRARLDDASHSATSERTSASHSGSAASAFVMTASARRHPQLLEHDEVLAALRHDAVIGGDDQECHVDARGTGNHGAHEVFVPRHVDDARREARGQFQRREVELDRDPALAFFRAAGPSDAR